MNRVALAALLMVCCGVAAAVELHDMKVRKSGGQFHVTAESTMAAPVDFVYAILVDYENFHRLTSGIAETRPLPPAEDGALLSYTRIDSCVWFFCREIERVERVFLEPNRSVATEALPEHSDFKVYTTQWLLQPDAGSTRISFEATMHPDFWVPPLIGGWAIRNKLKRTAEQVGSQIEYMFQNGLSLADLPAE
ncbi:MAG: SRPBCC family protein [Gammaproteobacteria bacterium]|nr:SRPBCC family protein [Gammaproteobacteria bacterium]